MSRTHNNKGFALVLTLLVIALIVAVTIQLNSLVRTELHASSNLRDGLKLVSIARSGFRFALNVLYEDGLSSAFDSLQEAWSAAERHSDLSSHLFDKGAFSVWITDHSAKIQINRLVDGDGKTNQKQKDLLMRFLQSPEFSLSPEQADNLIDAVIDWIDSDNDVTGFGAETAHYQRLKNPYGCRNGPLLYIEELLLVRGFSRELFFGSAEKEGIAPYLTTNGDGRININTAPPLVLRALSEEMDQEMVDQLLAFRKNKGTDLEDITWYTDIPGMAHIQLDPDLLTTASTYFEIVSEGKLGNMSRKITGFVERKTGKIPRVISWKME